MIEMPEVIFMVKNQAGELVTTNGGRFAWHDMDEARRVMNLSPQGAAMIRLETKTAGPARTIALREGCKMVYSIVEKSGIRPMVTSDTKEISLVLGIGRDLLKNEVTDFWFINHEGKRAKPEDVVYKMDIVK